MEEQARDTARPAETFGGRRRAVVAVIAGLVAAVTGKPSAPTVHATSGISPEGAMILGANSGVDGRSNNEATTTTLLSATGASGGGDNGALFVRQLAANARGIRAEGGASSHGVHGEVHSGVQGVGVRGNVTVGGGFGVFGSATSSGGVGVKGDGNAYGVTGSASASDGAGVQGQSSAGIGVEGSSSSNTGVRGISTSLYGVRGHSPTNTGVLGTTDSAGGYGVRGSGPGIAILGSSDTGTGVRGDGQGIGVLGIASGTGAGVGLRGGSVSGYGVLGSSVSGYGVYGSSDTGYAVTGVDAGSGVGVRGQTISGIGLQGFAGAGWAVYGEVTTGTAGRFQSTSGTGVVSIAPTAARFVGNVIVEGTLTIIGGAKSAAVPHHDGKHRRMYCMESPESYFEDFGSARLVNGHATVKIDDDFAAVVKRNDYFVFLTAEGDSNGLFVSSKQPGQFTVREQKGGTSNISFNYRLVAKRKDIEGQRLQDVTVLPAPPDIPTRLKDLPRPRPEHLEIAPIRDRPR